MQIGVLKERAAHEMRVAASPTTIKKLTSKGFKVVVESGAGLPSGFSDADFEQAGATIAESALNSDVVLCVKSPSGDSIGQLKSGAVVIGLFNPYQNAELQAFADAGVHAYAMELLPRTLSRAQNMDVLSSQANLAGYKAVLIAANAYQRPLPMYMTSAGTVKPAKVLVLGVGVAGLQAIATAKRLGAVVEASDLRPAAKEQVESLGAKWLDVPMSDEEKQKSKSTGGYAWTPSDEYIRDQAAVVDKAASGADIVITTALIPGRTAPRLIHEATIEKMKRGSVLLDMAVESGGNVAGSVFNETIETKNGVLIVGPANIPSTLAAQSSDLLANNLFNFLTGLIGDDQQLTLNHEDEIQKALRVTGDGNVLLNK